jgi:hypothetical protein
LRKPGQKPANALGFFTSRGTFLNAVSDSGKVQSFDVEGKEIIKDITDLGIKHEFYG